MYIRGYQARTLIPFAAIWQNLVGLPICEITSQIDVNGTHHTSHVTRLTSHVSRHTSHVTRHTSHLTRHTSHVSRHTSHVTPHTSHLTPDFAAHEIERVEQHIAAMLEMQLPQQVSAAALLDSFFLARCLCSVDTIANCDFMRCCCGITTFF